MAKQTRESATDYQVLALRCPVCITEFTSEIPVPGRRDGRDTDLRPRFAGADPLPTLIHSCPACRYTAYREGFEGPEASEEEDEVLVRSPGDRAPARFAPPADEDLDSLRRWIRGGELMRGMAGDREPFGAERYVLGARCFEYLQDEEPLGAADYFVRAAWCARAMRRPELERESLREASERLRRLLDAGQVPELEKARTVYLVGEFARRLGDFGLAVDQFTLIERSIEPDEEESAFFVWLARRQLALAMVKSDVNGVIGDRSAEQDDDEGRSDD